VASLIDIGKSGLQSYRQALTVTGQNIANINTDGYKRRAADLEEVIAKQGGITTSGAQTGLGVRVGDIRRSFDEFLLNKARSATSYSETNEKYVTTLKQLEDILLPGDSNLGNMIANFFDGLQEIAASPADLAPRVAALERGNSVANSFNQLAYLTSQLKAGVEFQIRQDINDINILNKELFSLNSQLTGTGQKNAQNALLDSRDALIDKMNEFAEVATTLDASGAAGLTLGNTGKGPQILSPNKQTILGIELVSDKLTFLLEPGADNTPTSQITNGSLRGLANAYQTIQSIEASIDNLAYVFSRDLNALHMNGLDLEGEDGQALFHTVSMEPEVNPTNLGDTTATVAISDFRNVQNQPVTFTYSEEKDIWIGRDDSNAIIAQGRGAVSVAGFIVNFAGEGSEGDQIFIKPAYNTAANIKLAISRPQEFAAASRQLVSADYSNTSMAEMTAEITSADTYVDTFPSIEDSFSNSLTMNAATNFIRNGSVAIIPANASNIELISLIQQSQLSYSLTDDEISSISSITLAVSADQETDDGSILTSQKKYVFSLTDTSIAETITEEGANLDAEALAKLMNFGLMTGVGYNLVTDSDGVESWEADGSSYSLQDLGGYASGKENQLTFALADSEFTDDSQIFANSQNLNGTITLRNQDISSIQVFTREGRHIAGSRLDDAQYEELFVPANGFDEDATYRDDYLNQSGDYGYLGMTSVYKSGATNPLINVENTDSDNVISFDIDFLDGVDTTETSFDGKKAGASTSYYQISLDDGINDAIERTLYQGQVVGNTEADIAKAMAAEIRSEAPIASLTGAAILLNQQQINPPDDFVAPVDGETTSFLTNNIKYTLTNTQGVISVSGGPQNALSDLAYDSENNQVYFTVSTEPDDGDSVIIEFEDQEYTLTMVDGEIEITGGEEDRLTAYFNSSLNFTVTDEVAEMGLNETKTVQYEGLDYEIAKDASGSLSVSGGADYALNLDISYDSDTGVAVISSQIRQIKVLSNDGSLTADKILIPGVDEEIDSITGNLEAAMRFGLVTNTQTPFVNYAFYNQSISDTTVSETKSELQTWTLTGFDEDYFSDIASDGSGGILYLGLDELEETDRVSSQSLSVSQTSADTSPVIQEVNGFSESAIAYYAGKTLTLSDGSNEIKVDFSIAGTIDSLDDVITAIQSATGYASLGFTVSAGDDALDLTYIANGEQDEAVATLTQDLSSFSVFISDDVTNAEELADLIRDELTTKLTNASGSYIDLDGNIISESSNAISKWVAVDNFGVQLDGTDILLTFDRDNNSELDDTNFTFSIDGDSGAQQESPARTNGTRVISGFAADDLTLLENSALSISNGSSTMLVEIDSTPADLDALVDLIQAHEDYENLSLTVRAGTDGLIFVDENDGEPLIERLEVKIIDSYPLNYNITRDGDQIITTSPAGTSANVTITATSSSVVGERLTLSDLPDEDLIIVLSGTGTRKISASYDINPDTTPTIERDITVKIVSQVDVHEVLIEDVTILSDIFVLGQMTLDASSVTDMDELVDAIQQDDNYQDLSFYVSSNDDSTGLKLTYKMQGFQDFIYISSNDTIYDVTRITESETTPIVEFIDTETNTSLATRYLDADGRTEAFGYKIDINGTAAYEDQFFIASNADGVGDNRNINAIIARQTADADGSNTGGFQEIFGTIITGLGSKVQSSQYAAEAAESIKNASLEAEASFSGVNLDTEASNLIELQQAYQASARILSTARELFDTLIQSV
jgi:flagellar hook-associated protein FlgK